MLLLLLLLLAAAANALSNDTEAPIPTDGFVLPHLASTREIRFPSREERLKIYMSNWYAPPCTEYSKGFVEFESLDLPDSQKQHTAHWPRIKIRVARDFDADTRDNESLVELIVDSAIEPDTTFYVDPDVVIDCLKPNETAKFPDRVIFRKNMNMYCEDAATSLLTAIAHVDWERKLQGEDASSIVVQPTLIQFGDLKHSHYFGNINVPHLKKFRSATTRDWLDSVTALECYTSPRDFLPNAHHTTYFQPIIWKLASRRHFGNLVRVFKEDTAWSLKKNMAIFRGQLTGAQADGYNKHRPALENCLKLRRCRLVYNHSNSSLVQAHLTSTRGRLPGSINGVNMMAPATTIRRLLEYKAIIMLEGNDVASGLKWALLSQSVVLMPRPKHTSWAMEELLEPWVHYIPLNQDATDVEEKMEWIISHDIEARRIAERGSLWIEDLVFHPDSAEDDRWIQEEIIRRYRQHFQHVAASIESIE